MSLGLTRNMDRSSHSSLEPRLFVLMMLIRAVVVLTSYPLLSRMGVGLKPRAQAPEEFSFLRWPQACCYVGFFFGKRLRLGFTASSGSQDFKQDKLLNAGKLNGGVA